MRESDIPPFLRHLRVDRRGIPVPYINLWGGHDVERMFVRRDRTVGRRAVFIDDSRETVPDFTSQNFQRQRECMTRSLCQVCGRQVYLHARHLVIAPLSVEHIELRGRRVPVVYEPWLHEHCGRFAIDKCPALIRRRRDEKLVLMAIPNPRDVQLVTSVGYVDGLAGTSPDRMCAMWVKALLIGSRAVGDHSVFADMGRRVG